MIERDGKRVHDSEGKDARRRERLRDNERKVGDWEKVGESKFGVEGVSGTE